MIPRRHRRRSQTLTDFLEITDLIRLWLLRLLVPLRMDREFVRKDCFQDDVLAEVLGLGEWIDDEKKDFDQKAVLSQLRKNHRACEHSLSDAAAPTGLTVNISRLSALVGLTDTDCRILEFAVFIHSESLLDETADLLGQLTTARVFQVLSVLLDIPEPRIREALSAKGVLAGSGLVTVEHDGSAVLRSKLKLLSHSFADILLYSDADPVALLRDMVIPSRPTTLNMDDFGHIRQSLKVLLPYLRHALETHRQGVNIFLHGVPGTGKSEFSRLLAKELACELFEVASEDSDGDSVDGDSRFRAFRAAQGFFSQRRTLLLFDEVEDVFDHGDNFFARKRLEESSKAWINRVLERNSIPTIWVSNSVDCLDRAFIRRFDMVIELPIPPKRQRELIVRNACGDMLPAASVRRIAETENLAPAIITRAVSVVQCLRDELTGEDLPKAVEHLIGNTLAAQGHRPIRCDDINRLPETYDPAFINADADLVLVAEGLTRTKSGRICLYGPPGTGKTAFGRWLAEKLEVPLCVKRASDLLSMYVGGTEHQIAAAFLEAEQEGALLLIDEVDSFLQDRRRAQRSWEVTEVNEMLTRMESFPGVFIASTNLMAGLDQGALRRFDLKVSFDFLKPEQAWALLTRHCEALGIAAPEPALKAHLIGLSALTPGDFAAVARQNRFRPVEAPAAFVSALAQECLMKGDGKRKAIGFSINAVTS